MYELIWVGENTYFIESPTKVGVYDMGDGKVCLIDSGNDKDAAKKILRILEEKGWTLDRILNTHFHADHIGGNYYLQEKTGCAIYAAGVDRVVMEYPILEPALLFGGCPPKPLCNKFLMAQGSRVQPLTPEVLPAGMSMVRLDGHSVAMSAFCTDDEIWFLADALTSEEVLEKYRIPFLYDPEEYLQSLDVLENLSGRLFIPSHAAPTEELQSLVQANRNKVERIIDLILNMCRSGVGFEELLGKLFDYFGLTLDLEQYALAGSTVRAYLSHLLDQGKLRIEFSGNRLFWKTVPQS